MIFLHGGPIWVYLLMFFVVMIIPTGIVFILLRKCILKKYQIELKTILSKLLFNIAIFLIAFLIVLLSNWLLKNIW